MFISLTTLKNEKISINVDKILFIAENKKGVSVILEDGTLLDLDENYNDLLRHFMPRKEFLGTLLGRLFNLPVSW